MTEIKPSAVPERVEAVARAIDPHVFRDDLTWNHSNMPEYGRELARIKARAALSVMGSGKVEVDREDLAEVAGFLQHMSGCSLVKFPMMKGHSCDCAPGRLRAVLEQEGSESE